MQHERIARGAFGHARRIGHAERGGGTAGGHQQAIDVAVIVAGELHDHRPAGVSAGQPDGAHRGLGAGVDQPDFLDRRHGLDHQLGQFVFGQGRRAETRAAMQGRLDGLDDRRMGVAEDHRAPGADVVDVAVAVDVEQVGPFGPVEEDRLAADAAERPGRAVHPAGHELFGPLEGQMALFVQHGAPVGQQIAVFPKSTSFAPLQSLISSFRFDGVSGDEHPNTRRWDFKVKKWPRSGNGLARPPFASMRHQD